MLPLIAAVAFQGVNPSRIYSLMAGDPAPPLKVSFLEAGAEAVGRIPEGCEALVQSFYRSGSKRRDPLASANRPEPLVRRRLDADAIEIDS